MDSGLIAYSHMNDHKIIFLQYHSLSFSDFDLTGNIGFKLKTSSLGKNSDFSSPPPFDLSELTPTIRKSYILLEQKNLHLKTHIHFFPQKIKI